MTDAAKPHTVNATLNITGGNVNIGANSGTSITMATLNVTGTTNVAALSSNAVINVSGGVVTLEGDIVRGASLVVWGIRDGRDVSEQMSKWLKAKAKSEKKAA